MSPQPEPKESFPPLFTLICRSVTFQLTHSQITFDSPNWFTSTFLSTSLLESLTTSSKPTTVYIDRDPDLVGIIIEYLSGYDMLPIERVWKGRGDYTLEGLRRNLKKDAEFFQLNGLMKGLEEEEENLRRVKEEEEKRRMIPPCSVGVLSALKMKWPLEVLDWEEYYLLGEEKKGYKGLVKLKDVELRFQVNLERTNKDSDWTPTSPEGGLPPRQITIISYIPTPSPPALPATPPPESNTDSKEVATHSFVAELTGSSNIYVNSESGSTGTGRFQLPMSLNGITESQVAFFDHPGFRAIESATYGSERSDTIRSFEGVPLVATVSEYEVPQLSSPNTNATGEKKEIFCEIFAHELYLTLSPKPKGSSCIDSNTQERSLQMTFARCSTFSQLAQDFYTSLPISDNNFR